VSYTKCPSVRASSDAGFLVAQIPEIDLDPFRICLSEAWRPAEFVFISLTVGFGAP
jgi:hypothetical protein